MNKSKKATSIIEAVIVLVIIWIWIVWSYKIFINSQKLSHTTKNRIQAIEIAREWIEIMKNIRDTNWMLYSFDRKKCWNTLNYSTDCYNTNSTNIENNKSYIIYKNSSNNQWYLSEKNTSSNFNTDYINNFKVWLDSDWFYTQSWSTTDLKPVFTREIKINYLDTNWDSFIIINWTDLTKLDEKMKVTSLVQWVDSSWTKPHKVELETILSNWEK